MFKVICYSYKIEDYFGDCDETFYNFEDAMNKAYDISRHEIEYEDEAIIVNEKNEPCAMFFNNGHFELLNVMYEVDVEKYFSC